MNKNHLEAMNDVALFQGICSEEYNTLIMCLSPQIKYFTKNEILLLTGDSVHHVGIIIDGTASAYLDHSSGSHTLITNLTPKSTFGEVLVSSRTHKSPVTIYATSDVTVAFIEYEKIYSMCATACSAHNLFLQNMIMTISDKYFYLFNRIAILREKTLRSKIIAYLYSLSENGISSSVTIPYSKTMLADYILSNRSALSKELRKMEDEGLIVVNGRNVELSFLKS